MLNNSRSGEKHTSGAKAQIDLMLFIARDKSPAYPKTSGSGEKLTSGANPNLILGLFMPGMMLAAARHPRPTPKPSLSAAC
jgi:hypothetical protein